MLSKTKKTELKHITFEVTSVCNLKCRYCYNIWKIPGTENFKHFNSYKQAKKTLSRLFKISNVEHVTFTGGEPFQAERFQELVLFTRMKKKSVAIITNGNAGTKEQYKQMVNIGVNLFELPIHSHISEPHDDMTQIKGSWEKSVNSVKELKKIGADVVVVIVITKINYKFIPETLKFIKELGVERVMLNRFNIGGEGINENKNLALNQEQLNEAYKSASKAGIELKMKLSSNVCTPMCIVNPGDYKNIYFTSCSPEVKKRPLTIDIKGDLRFCNHSPVVLGNIYKDKLEDMFSSEQAQLWSNVVPDFCSDCKLYSRCMAGCRAASEQIGQSVKLPDPIVQT